MATSKAIADRLLIQVLARLGQVQIQERFLSQGKPKETIDGLWIGPGQIAINPAHHVVDTLIHELLHDLFPQWSENYVRNRTKFLVNRLTEQQVETIYNEYQTKVERIF